MTTIAGLQIREKTFRNNTFKFACVQRGNDPNWWDPSWWSFTDEDSVREAFWKINRGDVVFDIGAAYGSYALTALACGAGLVFAWSPQGHPGAPQSEKEAAFMRESGALNGWGPEKLRIYEEGVFDRAGWLNARTQEFFPQLSENEIRTNDDILHVRPFAEWWADEIVQKGVELPGPHSGRHVWVKIDVEGAELQVLSQILAPLVSQFDPYILVENHNFKDPELEKKVAAEVTSWGYNHVSTLPYHSVSHSFFVP
jgi:FkbM family methyltransferase